MKNIVILISGRGSNMEALIAARDAGNLPVNIVAVISNRPDAAGLETAAKAGIVTHYIDHKAFAGREAFDAALAECIDGFSPDLVVLAGFMRILTDGFVERYAGRMFNIHPSLLPAFKGLHTHRRVLEEGVRVHGCTVHFVTPELDHGPVIIQAVAGALLTVVLVAIASRFAFLNGTSAVDALAAVTPQTGIAFASVAIAALLAQLMGTEIALSRRTDQGALQTVGQ